MSTPEKMTNCPTEETLAAFVDGRLDSRSRRQVLEHLATCADCEAIVSAAWDIQAADAAAAPRIVRPQMGVWDFEAAEAAHAADAAQAAAATDAAATPLVMRRRFRRPLWVAAVAAVLAGVFYLPVMQKWIASKRSGGMTDVVAGYGAFVERPVAPRFSGGFSHKKMKPTMRGDTAGEVSTLDNLELLQTAARLESRGANRTWKELRASAAAQLLLGDRQRAVQLIDDAVARGGSDPSLLNDRAAIYVASGHKNAVAAAEQAWQLAKTPESAWNRALAYDNAQRDDAALRAWEDYLKLEPAGPWADEARSKMTELRDLMELTRQPVELP